jgi:hemoglobin
MKKKILTLAVLSLLALAPIWIPSTDAKDEKKATPAEKVDSDSIYARLGGQPAMDAAVDRFYERVLADDRVNHFFEDVNMNRQIKKQKAFLSAAFGGPVAYEGKDMRAAHKHLDLTEADFTAIAENLQATLNDLKVDKNLSAEIMTLVASTKDAVLNKGKANAKDSAQKKEAAAKS